MSTSRTFTRLEEASEEDQKTRISRSYSEGDVNRKPSLLDSVKSRANSTGKLVSGLVDPLVKKVVNSSEAKHIERRRSSVSKKITSRKRFSLLTSPREKNDDTKPLLGDSDEKSGISPLAQKQ